MRPLTLRKIVLSALPEISRRWPCRIPAVYVSFISFARLLTEKCHHRQYCCATLPSQGYGSHCFHRVYLHFLCVFSCVITTARSSTKQTIIILSGTELTTGTQYRHCGIPTVTMYYLRLSSVPYQRVLSERQFSTKFAKYRRTLM